MGHYMSMKKLKRKIIRWLKRFNKLLSDYDLIWMPCLLLLYGIMIYTKYPELINFFNGFILICGIILFMIIFCPVLTMIIVLVPIVIVANKIRKIFWHDKT
jgi:hypothetical protein